MSILRRLLGGPEERALSYQDVWGAGGPTVGGKSKAGIAVDPGKALSLSAAYACIRVLSEDVAALPLDTFAKAADRRLPAPTPRWLATPNPEITAFELFERLMGSLATHGNAYAHIVRDPEDGRPLELWPLDAGEVTPERDPDTRELRFKVGKGPQPEYVPWPLMVHIRGLTAKGNDLKGISPIEKAREAIGLGLAAEEFGARFFANGAAAGGVLEVAGQLDDEMAARIARRWVKAHGGLGQSHLPAVLEGGAAWKPLTIPPDQAQFLETRKFQVAEVARFFRMPPHKIGDLERATFSNIEHQGIDYVVSTLRPWLVRIESALRWLLPPGQYARFNVAGLLRGDVQSRYTAYSQARAAGWMTVNEIRALEDLPPVAEGDGLLQPLAMAPLGTDPTKDRSA